MRVDVYQLPPAALAVESFQKRGEAAYLNAHEELRAAVATAIGGGAPQKPYAKAALTIVCYVGKVKHDGMYRPQKTNKLHLVLDPIYRALLDANVIADMAAVPSITTMLVRDAEHEGFRILIREIEQAGSGDGARSTRE